MIQRKPMIDLYVELPMSRYEAGLINNKFTIIVRQGLNYFDISNGELVDIELLKDEMPLSELVDNIVNQNNYIFFLNEVCRKLNNMVGEKNYKRICLNTLMDLMINTKGENISELSIINALLKEETDQNIAQIFTSYYFTKKEELNTLRNNSKIMFESQNKSVYNFPFSLIECKNEYFKKKNLKEKYLKLNNLSFIKTTVTYRNEKVIDYYSIYDEIGKEKLCSSKDERFIKAAEIAVFDYNKCIMTETKIEKIFDLKDEIGIISPDEMIDLYEKSSINNNKKEDLNTYIPKDYVKSLLNVSCLLNNEKVNKTKQLIK